MPAQFVLAAWRTAVLHATVPGTVTSVAVSEGQQVRAGIPLLRMSNLELESQAAQAGTELSAATVQATQAALRYSDFAGREQERRHRVENQAVASEKLRQLSVVSPISGVVVTPHLADLDGRVLDEGDALLELDDTSQIRAKLYIPEFAMHDLRPAAPVRLLINGRIRPLSGKLSLIAQTSVPMAEGLASKEQLQGINPPRFYVADVPLKNEQGTLMVGMSGSAKVLITRRSLAGFLFRFGRDLAARKIW